MKTNSFSRRAILNGAMMGGASLAMPRLAFGAPLSASPVIAKPYLVPDKLAGAATMVAPSKVRVGGWLGDRIAINATARLNSVDLEPLLAGFRKKPGSHPWIGEHLGKWLHAATLAWASTGDAKLKTRLDYAAKELIATQEADGYLGTYLPSDRLALVKHAGWDVWSHKYCMIGLLTYYRYTDYEPALTASRKACDLLISTFPAKRSILQAGYHSGMAATSVLEPVVLLHRMTGDKRYLDFAFYIVKSWEEQDGPDIVRTLLAKKDVEAVGNAKAYEMLSNIVGICELARVTGDKRLIDASVTAWDDIVATQLFVTGATSDGEFFQPDDHRGTDDMARVGETCVTTTWIQFNQALFQLTGEARYGNELERTYYNALAAAQHPDGHDWTYFTSLNGRKKYDKDITCCHSSGPRGMAMAPQSSYLAGREAGADMLMVSTFESSTGRLTLGGREVTVEQVSGFPEKGSSRLKLRMAKPARFGLKVRAPEWAMPLSLKGATIKEGWLVLPPRDWRDGEEIAFDFAMAPRLTLGTDLLKGRQTQHWGPFVLALEANANAELGPSEMLHYKEPVKLAASEPKLQFTTPVTPGLPPRHHKESGEWLRPANLVTYADAGADRGYFRIWLRS